MVTVDDLKRGAIQDLEIAMRSKAGLIWATTTEEMRVERAVTSVCLKLNYKVWLWSVTGGIVDIDGKSVKPQSESPAEAIKFCLASDQRIALIMRDLSQWLSDPITLRQTKDLNRYIPARPGPSALQVVVVDTAPPESGLPCTQIAWPLPDRGELSEILDRLLEIAPESAKKEAAENGNREAIIDAAVGLTGNQVAIGLAKSLVSLKRFEPTLIAEEKKNAIRDTGLEWQEVNKNGMNDVGGLDGLKSWLKKRHAGFTPAGREYGLPAPKGVLLVGVPGCGKSLTAKCVSASWGVPLVRLDIGALFSKWVGESEQTVRTALQIAETIAPCVLWLDEIEKSGFGAEGDAGTSQRVFATFLTWMQERTASVFVVATANDVSKLPPEFMRAGRWDDVFFVNLPNITERAEIAKVLSGKFAQCGDVDAGVLAEQSNGYTGAEIEAAIKAALYTQYENDAPVTTESVVQELQQMVPISRSQSTKIGELMEWANGNARSATTKKVAGNGTPEFDLS